MKDPARIFNMDESSIRLVPTKECVFAETGEKYVHTSNANSEKECYTVLFSASAAGVLAPPMVLFPYKQRLPAEIAHSAPDGWSIGKNVSGWMTQETFSEYLKNVFHPWLLLSKIALPVIVFVDGHKSHVSLQTTEFCRENQIVLVCLFPNSTHVLQPLDVTFFRGLKVKWNKRLIDWRTHRAGDPLRRHEFAPLLKRAVDDMVDKSSTLANGFRKCGLFPWNPDAVNYAMLLTKKSPQKTTSADLPSDSPQSATNSTQNMEAKATLLGLESYLRVAQLKRFEDSYSNVVWSGPVGDTGLFYVWQEMKRDACGNQIEEEPEETFYGFDELNMNDERRIINSKYASIGVELIPGSGASTQDRLQPEIVGHNAPKDISQQPKASTEDTFEQVFSKPSVSVPSTKSVKKYRTRAPAVATSEAFRKYFHELEQDKINVE
ncbi:uncharacterized protein LOC134219279 [Armigeres subalbatus]|uniref:uncharacterized protein LOC134219279 n=1 Tax=Armigeres subalbatus TaxID=124917 RepID=UPI002ED2D974